VLADEAFATGGAETQLTTPLADHQGSARILYGGAPNSAPAVRQSVDYAPFGRITELRDSTGAPTTSALDAAFGHHGSLLDQETGLQLKGAPIFANEDERRPAFLHDPNWIAGRQRALSEHVCAQRRWLLSMPLRQIFHVIEEPGWNSHPLSVGGGLGFANNHPNDASNVLSMSCLGMPPAQRRRNPSTRS
jgi:hypothetical protein